MTGNIATVIASFVITILVVGSVIYRIYSGIQLSWASRQAEQHTICPSCHQAIYLEFFMCNKCGLIHELVPVEGEIFYKMCPCGTRLPKLPQHGREKLDAFCPNHKTYFPIGKRIKNHPDILFPIVGGTSTGKSAFLIAWSVIVQGQLPFQYGVNITFPSAVDSEYAAGCARRFQQGVDPNKTSDFNPHGVVMDIASRTTRKGVRLYLYDPAGEVFDPHREDSENSLIPFKYYDFMDGVVFMIDPFSIPCLRKKYPPSLLNSHGFQASDKRIADSCDKFIRGLYEHDLARDEYHYASCAVVITKADAFDLDSLIGEEAARKKMAANPDLSFEEALDEVCSTQLKKWELGHVLELLEDHFKEVRCFSVSAYGHSPQNGVPFTPKRIELPVLWLLNKTGTKIFTLR